MRKFEVLVHKGADGDVLACHPCAVRAGYLARPLGKSDPEAECEFCERSVKHVIRETVRG